MAFASVAAKFDPNIERFLRGVSYRIFVSNLFYDIPLNNRSDSKKNMNEILSSFQLNIFFLKKGGGGSFRKKDACNSKYIVGKLEARI